MSRKALLQGLTGSRDGKAPRAQISPEGFLSPENSDRTFPIVSPLPWSLPLSAINDQRSTCCLLPSADSLPRPSQTQKGTLDLQKSILTVPASSTSSRIAAITCSRRRNGALSVVLSGLIDYQPFSIIAIPPSLSLLSTPFSTHHEFPTFLSPISRISLLLQGDLLPLAADRQGN
jgi:hypothetical protein